MASGFGYRVGSDADSARDVGLGDRARARESDLPDPRPRGTRHVLRDLPRARLWYRFGVEFARRRNLYNRCNPDESLGPEDVRNVDVDAKGVRGEHWAEQLAARVMLSNEPLCQLFTGLRGSGKSTELRRLVAAMEKEGYLAIRIDADEHLDLTREIDVSDVLAIITREVDMSVARLEGRAKPSDTEPPADGYFTRVWNWLLTTDVGVTKLGATAGVPGAASAMGEVSFKTNPTLRERVRAVVANHTATFVRMVHEALGVLDEKARQAGRPAGLFIVFDSLEKLRGTTMNWSAIVASAERLFADGARHLRLPVPVVYTVPPALALRIAGVEYFPMIKVRDRRDEGWKPGIDVVLDIVRLRFGDDLEAVLGKAEQAELRMRELAMWSGGYPREVVRVLQRLLERGPFPIDRIALTETLNREGNALREIVRSHWEAKDWLVAVHTGKSMQLSDDRARELAARLLELNVVLHYKNDDSWDDVHPALLEMTDLFPNKASTTGP